MLLLESHSLRRVQAGLRDLCTVKLGSKWRQAVCGMMFDVCSTGDQTAAKQSTYGHLYICYASAPWMQLGEQEPPKEL